MNLENNNVTEFNGGKKSLKSNFNIKEELLKYAKKWYWFLLSFIIFSVLAYIYLSYKIPQYNVSATIAISPEDNISESGLDAFKEFGLVNKTKNKIENEIQVLKSRTLIRNIVESKKLHIQYFVEGKILEIESYPKSAIEINFLSADSIINTKSKEFFVEINSTTNFSFLNKDLEKISEGIFGKVIPTDVGNVVITPNDKNSNFGIGKIIKIKLTPVKDLVEQYRRRLNIHTANQGSSVVHISLNDPIVKRATDFINTLIDDYGESTIEHKKNVSTKRANFIKDRLRLISTDLTTVEGEAAGYKSKFGLAGDLNAQTARVAGFGTQNSQEIAATETQLRLIKSMQGFIQSQDGKNDVIPGNLGFNDPSIVNNIGRYNTLIVQRKRLLKTSSIQNPVVVNIDEEINSIRQGLKGSLRNLESSINIKLNSLRTTGKYFSGKLYVAPKRQMDLKAIEREQAVKEQLYLFLLQKREEAEITSHITVSNSRIIDKASTYGSYLISPNKKKTYLAAIFLSFIFPFLLIYLTDLFNTKIRSKQDIENVTSIPLLGSIPKSKIKNKIVVSKNDRSSVSESFRILQTNLNFLLAEVKKNRGKTLFVTSGVSGEGKTFISSNLAKILAASGNKVAYVGTDFRYPKFHEFLELPKGQNTLGFTNYIMNDKLTEEDIIYTQKTDDPIDIVPPGAIPPNPTGLLMNSRVKQMFSYLEEQYDYIVVDTSPVNLVTDTMLISNFADMTIYVVREDFTDKQLLSIPEKLYKNKRLVNLAILHNAEKSNIVGGYGYGYGVKD